MVGHAQLPHARSGKGPVLVEAFTYRMGAHTTADDPSKYRDAAITEQWKAKDPISRLRAHLEKSGLADDGFFAEVDAEADALAARIRKACMEMPEPDPGKDAPAPSIAPLESKAPRMKWSSGGWPRRVA